jgi:non-specific serine/threonine protein kinase
MLLRHGSAADHQRAVEMLRSAAATAERLGMDGLSRPIAALLEPEGGREARRTVPAVVAPRTAVFRRDGDFWTLAFDGRECRLKDSKGLRFVARLLAHPGREVHALDFFLDRTGEEDLAPHLRASLGDQILDHQAIADYRRRLGELREQLDEARTFNDPRRATRLSEEIEQLTEQLGAGVGAGGRPRRSASAVERARLSVTKAVRASLARIEASHPALAYHLRAGIRTGTYCSYRSDPANPVAWQL